jgi:hypothetical protein
MQPRTGSEIVKKAKLARILIAIASASSELERAKIRRQLKRGVK